MRFFIHYRLVTILILALMVSQNSFGFNLKPVIYLIPGQGSDYRLFKNLQIDSTFEVRNISYCIPDENMTLPEFARELSIQIDTLRPYLLIGVSLGGMIATEMGEFMNPEKIILISSAKCRDELPRRYKFQHGLPIYKIVSGKTAKRGAKLLQPIVEPDRKNEKETFINMLNDKEPDFLKRTLKMIFEWERVDYPSDIIHIHGDKDSTIPIRNVNYDYVIKGGSHMMVLTRSTEISELINDILTKN
ncbi:MAG: alpha/beta hydrolase [Cyclobacteriaceae bacterium]|nr:alpha/beta hydrolase [Cyclobacteriaceae bacterium]